MNKNKNTWRFATYQTERLSSIPSMASAVSKKISKFQQHHKQLVDDACLFFETYQSDIKKLKKLRKNLASYTSQINIITDYRNKNGKLPLIAGQKSTDKYLTQLYKFEQQRKKELQAHSEAMSLQRKHRYETLDHLTDSMLDLLNNQRIFSQFLGTIVLSTPLPDEKIRCVRNEKFKPIYIAGLVVALFEELRLTHNFENSYLKESMADLFQESSASFMSLEQNNLPVEVMAEYREEILKPIAKAALLLSIGSYSPEAEEIFNGDRYRHLTDEERIHLVETVRLKSIDYLKYGIGVIQKKVNTHQEKLEYVQYERNKLKFMLSFFQIENSENSELLKLIRIPLIYSSFMVSTKPEFDYQNIYKAYETLQESAKMREIDPFYTKLFLSMVGKFPLGSGIYFIAKQSGKVEKAIVSSLYPSDPEQPICKQITRNQIQSLSQKEIIIPQSSNLFFAASRRRSEFSDEFYKLKFNNIYTWNANEVWEVQISALEFWKKDGTRIINGPDQDIT